ncbi:hypothetical protein GCM10020000_69290 [Streptomyces olivoverticillatus]
MSRQDPGSTLWFTLSIDGESLGYFNGCDGLSSQVETEQRQEGGNNGFVWHLPTRVTFSTIRLTRPPHPGHHEGRQVDLLRPDGHRATHRPDHGAARGRLGGRALGADRRTARQLAGTRSRPGQSGRRHGGPGDRASRVHRLTTDDRRPDDH